MGRHSVSVDTKWQVIGMSKTGMSDRSIGTALNVSKTCVENTVKRFKESGTVIEAPRSGRPRKTSPRQDHKLIILSRKNRNASASDLQGMLNSEGTMNVSMSTISERLRERGLFLLCPQKTATEQLGEGTSMQKSFWLAKRSMKTCGFH